ncbi:uncharacterized protein LOC143218191 [Lasioglossum baleicum]|uniref:uncharacterized protein LOC143218191 n=1 Tax=Lasioglossum baleicum TaxID=434251 RepID=UPI003FCD8DCB
MECSARLLRRIQKIGLSRVRSSYRSVAVETPCVLEGVTPWVLKIRERKHLFHWENAFLEQDQREGATRPRRNATRRMMEGAYHDEEWDPQEFIAVPDPEEFHAERKGEETEEERRKALKRWLRKKAKENSATEWQERCDESDVGRWTHQLIPNIRDWKERKHGHLNFYLTQDLTGHGVFNTFRFRIGKSDTEDCWFDAGVRVTHEHTLIECQRWEVERRQLKEDLGLRGRTLTMEDIMRRILQSENAWNKFSGYCRAIMKENKEEERRRERNEEDSENPLTDDDDQAT